MSKYKYKIGQRVTAIRLVAAISACFNGAEVKLEGIIMSRYTRKGQRAYVLLCNAGSINAHSDSAWEFEIDRGMRQTQTLGLDNCTDKV